MWYWFSKKKTVSPSAPPKNHCCKIHIISLFYDSTTMKISQLPWAGKWRRAEGNRPSIFQGVSIPEIKPGRSIILCTRCRQDKYSYVMTQCFRRRARCSMYCNFWRLALAAIFCACRAPRHGATWALWPGERPPCLDVAEWRNLFCFHNWAFSLWEIGGSEGSGCRKNGKSKLVTSCTGHIFREHVSKCYINAHRPSRPTSASSKRSGGLSCAWFSIAQVDDKIFS
jgi:hypothetical protein